MCTGWEQARHIVRDVFQIPDLLSLVLELTPKFPGQIQNKSWYGWASQAILLEAVRQVFSPKLSQSMHLDNLRRAYTASSLYLEGEISRSLAAERRYFLRFTALNEECARALIRTTQPGQPLCPGSQLNLSGLQMRIVGIYVQHLQHMLAQTSSYECLFDSTTRNAASLNERITFRLGSATFFKSTDTGGFQYEPTPALVFGSLFERWKLYSSVRASGAEFLEYVDQSVSVGDQALELAEVGGKYKRQGAVGTVTYISADPQSQYWVFAHVLARYALFAGVGKETASGFGQCWALCDQDI